MEDHEKNHSCKLCGKEFPCGRSLGGHMRSHMILISSSSSSSHHHHQKKLRLFSNRKPVKNPKKANKSSSPSEEYNTSLQESPCKNKGTSSSLTDASNYSPPVSDIINQREQEEVALSLIILSRDKGNWDCSVDPIFEFSDNMLEFNKTRNDSKKRKLEVLGDSGKQSEFKCSDCKKAFSSYQALGGHRASYKKFNGCCGPRSNKVPFGSNRSKDKKAHECSVCYKVFSSGQALGGHKRSHLVLADREAEKNDKVRTFFDLNLSPPQDDEEECNGFVEPAFVYT
ncbi:Zinc finger protein ZAT1 [Striga hermonthica]|uniref:Zinc finger protein ZAT1 n=1 Tax=Striga hermonthica TaxID=68872 RepID=A0A9N7N9X4_STRHE|nr:Zinc finger protein ZAT1 [Striga hermonthica]